MTNKEQKMIAEIHGPILSKICEVADREGYDRNNLMQTVASIFSTFAEISNIENYVPDINVGKKWIPCSEDLPDDNDIAEVLACQRDGTMSIVTGLTVCNNKKIFLAWMPLPEPYKENE